MPQYIRQEKDRSKGVDAVVLLQTETENNLDFLNVNGFGFQCY